MGNALPTYSEYGYGYAVEKAPTTRGWSYPVFEELWNYEFPQEMHHFARCVRGKDQPQATGEDGRFVQEVLLAGYQSAGLGTQVTMPFRPTGVRRPASDRSVAATLAAGCRWVVVESTDDARCSHRGGRVSLRAATDHHESCTYLVPFHR